MKFAATVLLLSLTAVSSSCDSSTNQAMNDSDSKKEELRIETDEGTVVSHTTEEITVPQKVAPVQRAESQMFEAWARDAASFLTAYGTPRPENELKQYDSAFKAWQDSSTRKHTHQDVINILGAYLGQRLVQDFDMEWVVVTDEYGQDYAVRHRTTELMSFPFSSVMKRIEDKEYDFIHGVYHIIKHEIENGRTKKRSDSERAEQAPLPPKPND